MQAWFSSFREVPMNPWSTCNAGLCWRNANEIVLIQPWGSDSLRVRATVNAELCDWDWALLPPASMEAKVEIGKQRHDHQRRHTRGARAPPGDAPSGCLPACRRALDGCSLRPETGRRPMAMCRGAAGTHPGLPAGRSQPGHLWVLAVSQGGLGINSSKTCRAFHPDIGFRALP